MLLKGQKFRFDDFLLDAKEKTLTRGKETLSITPKAFSLLLVLLENYGHLVEKEELMNSVWAESFVEESNLSFTIGLLRKALGDNAQNPRFIETIPKRGYRFIADVKILDVEDEKKKSSESFEDSELSSKEMIFSGEKLTPRFGESKSSDTAAVAIAADRLAEENDKLEETNRLQFSPETVSEEKAEKSHSIKRTGKWRIFTATAAVVLFLVASTILGYYVFTRKSTAVSGKKSIAILPFKPINTTNRDEIYEIGIADSLIHRLSSLKGITVRPLNAIRRYADIEQDPIAAGQEQQVDYVLASNYQLSGGKIRVTAQLFNIADGQIEETYKSEKEVTDIFAMQDAVADHISELLLKQFETASVSPPAKRGTSNEEAYRLYLQGIYLYDKRELADAQKAVEVLEQAVRLDPNYAHAWAGKGYAHRIIGNYGRKTDSHEEYRKSIEAVNKALSLDENLSEAYSALCDNKMYYEYDFPEAEKACQRAIELAPDSPLAHQVYSRYLNSRGRADEAISEIKTAIDLEPTSFHNQRNLGVSLYFARRYEEAIAQFKRVIATDKNNATSYKWLSFALQMQDDDHETFEWFVEMLKIQNTDETVIQSLQNAFQTSGWKGVMQERLNEFEQVNESYFEGAAYYVQLGNNDKAFEFLEKSFERRELWIANLQADPRFEPLYKDSRFKQLIKRIESR